MLNIYVGTHERFARVEPVCEYAIRKHCPRADELTITFLRPDRFKYPSTGCTGFTNMRYAIANICDASWAIYIDVDMLVLEDIMQLMQYATPHRWARLKDHATEVLVIDCNVNVNDQLIRTEKKTQLESRVPWESCIPLHWNVEDPAVILPDMANIHFTNLKTQPWFDYNNQTQAAELWRRYENENGLLS